MRQDAPGPRRVLKMSEIENLFRLSCSQIHRHMKAKNSPKTINRSRAASVRFGTRTK